MGEVKKERFQILLQQVPPSDDLREAFLEGEIERLEVDVILKKWSFHFLLPYMVSAESLGKWVEQLTHRFSSIAAVEAYFTYRKTPSLQEGISAYWPLLLLELKKIWPSFSLRRYQEIMPAVEGQYLHFPAINGTSLEYLKSQKADEVIASFYQRWLGIRPMVRLVVTEEAEEIQANFLKMREEEDEQLAIDLAKEEMDEKNGAEDEGEKAVQEKEPLIFGYPIQDEPVPLASILEEERRITIQGSIFNIDLRELKTGRVLYTLKVTDFTNSIQVKVFSKGKEDGEKLDRLRIGMWIKVRGSVQDDAYARELVMVANDINEVFLAEKEDCAGEKRVELHLHTNMSAMDSNLSAKKAIERAAKWGHPAIAITDHGVVQAFPEAYEAAHKYGIKLIFGMEAYVVDDGVPIVHRQAERDIVADTYVIFDVETTGLSAAYDTIIELAAVKMRNGDVIDRFERFADPHRPLPAKIKELTGITDEMLVGAPELSDVLRDFKSFIEGTTLAAHNARFDIGFLQAGFRKFNLGEITNPVIDTLEMARNFVPGLKNYKLNTLCAHFGIELVSHHRAVYDAEATGHLLWRMIRDLRDKGVKDQLQLNEMRDVKDLHRQRPFHATILVLNEVGLKNLYKLISMSYLKYFHRTPRIPKAELAKHREGLLIGSACDEGEIFEYAMQKSESELEELAQFYDYLEIQPLSFYQHLIEKELIQSEFHLQEIIKKIVRVGEKLGKPVVATGNVHHLEPRDVEYRRILIKNQNGPKSRDPERLPPQYFRTTDEMLSEFQFLGKEKAYEVVVKSTQAIASLVQEMKPFPDELFAPIIEGAEDEIRNMSYQTAYSIYGNPLPEIVEQRLEKELNSIINNGFAVVYLISHKLVNKSLEDGYLVGSRGSVGSSFVATMTRITEVNPLPPHYVCPNCKYSEFFNDGSVGSGFDLPKKDCPRCSTPLKGDGHDIPFETFMGFKGDKVPDIDLNFSGEYQPRAHKYTEELFGSEYVYRAGTISTVAEKTAFGFVRKVMEEEGRVIRSAELERLALGCTGVKRTTGQHPGGLMVIPQYKDVYDFTPIQHPADDPNSGTITTHFDYHAISGRLLKLDILGHDDPTVIRMLQDLSNIDPKDIPVTDPEVMKIFSGTESLGKDLDLEAIGCTTGTLGIPEFGTRFVRQMLEDTKPSTFAELVQISGLSHGTDVWLNNAQELIRNKVAALKEVIGCRDDIMVYLIHKGLEPSRAFKIMESVRKGKGIPPEDQAYMRQFNVPEWYIDSCLKIKYMFPKAHAAAYVLMALRIAYFKVYHPILFYATYFTVRADDFDIALALQGAERVKEKILEINGKGNDASPKEKNLLTVLELVYEMLKRGFHFKNVDLYKSDSTRFLVDGDSLIPPFNAIPGVGKTAAINIVKAREEAEFLSKEDLQQRSRVSKTVMELLEGYGCLKELPESNQLTLFNF